MSFSAGKNLQNNINTTEAQTLSNKTLDNTNAIDGASVDNSTITGASIESPSRLDMKKDTLANLQTYAASATNGQLVYATDAKKTFQVVDAALVEVGSGDGSVNYIENSDFEQGVDGYTGDVNFTIAQTELVAEVLRGTASAKLSKAAVDASNEEISVPFTVDRGDLAKKLTISFEYDASDANYADDDILIGVRQDPNGTPSVIRINGEDLKGGKGTHYAQFQTDASIDEYELFFKVNSTNASAYDIIIDDVKVGPRELAKGTIVTDWVSYTPTFTGIGTATNVSFKYKRVGDSLLIQGYFDSGTVSATALSISMPNGLNVNTDKVSSVANTAKVGQFSRFNNGSGYSSVLYAAFVDPVTDTNLIYVGNVYPNDDTFRKENASDALQTGDAAFINVEVPIQGWSSNAVTSEDLGGREVAARYTSDITTSVNSSASVIPFEDVDYDTHNAYDTSTGLYTVPETGYYQVTATITSAVTSWSSSNSYWMIKFYKNGSEISQSYDRLGQIGTTALSHSTSNTFYLEKGDTFAVYGQSNISTTLAGIGTINNFSIQKLASPQTILETETVAARYTSNSGQNTTSGGGIFVYEDLDYDTHNAYNTSTGIYTVPVSGYYDIKAKFKPENVSVQDTQINIRKNSTGVSNFRNRLSSVNNQDQSISINDLIYAEKGDTIDIFATTNVTSASATNGSINTFSINRIK